MKWLEQKWLERNMFFLRREIERPSKVSTQPTRRGGGPPPPPN